MATVVRPSEIIEINDDSSDDQRRPTPRRPSRLQAIDASLITRRDLPTTRGSSFGARSIQATTNKLPSPIVDLDVDLDGDVIDSAFLNMEDTPGRPTEPLMNVDILLDFDACLREVLEIFPDISHDHVQELYDVQLPHPVDGQTVAQNLITQILDKGKYPKEKDRLKELKRKRFADSDGMYFSWHDLLLSIVRLTHELFV